MEVLSKRLPLPKSESRMQDLMLQLMRLPMLQELKLTVQGIEVKRGVEDGEPVVPESIEEFAKGVEPPAPDVDFMLKRLSMVELEPDEGRHQLTTLIAMMSKMRQLGCVPCDWYVCVGDGLDAFLAQPRDTLPAFLFDVPVHYVSDIVVPEGRLVLVGSPTRYSIDATHGVTAEIGA